jgi:tRNA-modifying protein YgfZ
VSLKTCLRKLSIKGNINLNNLQTTIEAARTGAAIYDSSTWGKILVSDRDRLRFLHNQSTADFEKRQPGALCDTVFVTSTARTLDLATGVILDDEVLLIVSPNRREFLFNWLDKYIFFADRVTLKDITNSVASFTLMGAQSAEILAQWGGLKLSDLPQSGHKTYHIDGIEVRIAIGTELGLPGYRLIIMGGASPAENRSQSATLQQSLTNLGAMILGEDAWECLRVAQGRPKPDAELTEDYNPLEVGLWQTISFSKGCYIGQETIARLNTYKGVKQYLWGIKLAGAVAVGTVITLDGEKVGVLTSYSEIDGEGLGLGYVRSKAGGVGLRVMVGDIEGEITSIPFVQHEYPA